MTEDGQPQAGPEIARATSMGLYLDLLAEFLRIADTNRDLKHLPPESIVAAYHGWRIETRNAGFLPLMSGPRPSDRPTPNRAGPSPALESPGPSTRGNDPGPEMRLIAPTPAPSKAQNCPEHNQPFKWVPPGFSRKTNKNYDGFWTCTVLGCKRKPTGGA